MVKVIQKRLALLFTVLLILGTLGCQSNQTGTQGKDSSGKQEASGTGTEKNKPASSQTSGSEEREIYTIQILRDATDRELMSDNTEVGKYMKERFGVVIEFVPYAGDMIEKQKQMLAAEDYNELQYMQREDMVMSYINAGALLELDPYLDNMPDFVSRFKDIMPYWRIPGKGKLYKWETTIPSDTMGNLDVAVRSDLLEHYGWEQPLSVDEWFEFIKKAKNDFPTEDGMATVGMTLPMAEAWGLKGIVPCLYEKGDTYVGIGNEGFIYNAKTKQMEDYFQNKYVKESFAFFNKLYREGLLDEECFTDTLDKTIEKCQQARALTVWYPLMLSANNALREVGKEKKEYVMMPVQSNTMVAEGQKRIQTIGTSSPFNSYGLTKKCRYPERLLEIVDWASSEEGQIILTSGFEGVHWTKDESGKRLPTDALVRTLTDAEFAKKQGIGAFGIFPRFDAKDANGQYYKVFGNSDIAVKYAPRTRTNEVYEAYGWINKDTWYINNAVYADIGFAPSAQIDPTTDLGKVHQKMVEVRANHTARLIMAESDEEFEKIYQDAMKEYDKLDHQSVIDELNRQLNESEAELNKYR